jgi:rubrerythrin
MSRAGFVRGSGALLVSATGLGTFAPSALADAPPDGDLAYLRLLIAAELLALDFYSQLSSRRVGLKRIAADEREHYRLLAALMTAAGQTPAAPGDIDISYPAKTFSSRHAILSFAKELERMLEGAYIDALEHVQTPAYRVTLARILAREAQHHSAVAALFGEPVIGAMPTRVSMEQMSNFLGRYES